MVELSAEEMLLTFAATISEEEMGSMISSSELSQLIKEQNDSRISVKPINDN